MSDLYFLSFLNSELIKISYLRSRKYTLEGAINCCEIVAICNPAGLLETCDIMVAQEMNDRLSSTRRYSGAPDTATPLPKLLPFCGNSWQNANFATARPQSSMAVHRNYIKLVLLSSRSQLRSPRSPYALESKILPVFYPAGESLVSKDR